MRSDQSKIVQCARGWIGTPYVHQATCRGGGTDCLGLVRGVWRDLYGSEPSRVPAYSRDWSEPQRAEVLWQAARRHLRVKDLRDAQPGDVLLFRMRERAVAKHLGIQTVTGEQPAFVHAYMRHGVVESPLSTPWARRIVARFAFPKEVF